VWCAIRQRALDDGAAIAVHGAGDVALSYAELIREVERAAQRLRSAGVRRLGLLADNGIDWIVSDLAALALGLPCVPLPGFFSAAQLEHAVGTAGLDAVLTDAAAHVARGLGFTRRPDAGVRGLELLRSSGSSSRLPGGVSKLTFTSGTTGSPKAVCLSRAALQAVCASLASATGAERGDTHLCLLPLSILLENVGGVYRTLATGGTVVALPLARVGLRGSSELDAGLLQAALRRVRPTSAIAMPEMLRALTDAGGEALHADRWMRFLGVGGARVPSDWLQAAQAARIPAYEGYGLSEVGSVVALNTPDSNIIGSAGRLLPHCEARVDGQGQIHIRGSLALGYLDVDGFSPLRRDAQGFYATGDLGRLDGEHVYVEGRCNRRIITSFGRNVSPEWIEAELLGHPGVVRAVVSGEGQASLSAVLEAQDAARRSIDAHVRALNQRLPDYARIANWRLVGEGVSTPGGADAVS
jgi:long-subunit acyl-CoA synthetase (AMP-forming)